jgi:hypothetical protein
MFRFLSCVSFCALSSAAMAAPIQWSSTAGGNDRFYEVFTGNAYTWEQADAIASSLSHNGLGGHLATITSQAENDFIYSIAGPDWAWLGGQRVGNTNSFEWVRGDEAGTVFYNNGPVFGTYSNFNPGEPNGLNNGENGVHMWLGGYWNDLPTFGQINFIVEYGVVAPVPLPAGGLLLLGGLGVLAARRKRT